MPRLIRRDRPDLIHVQYTAPLLGRTPVVVTVHDVSFLEHPEYFTGVRRAQLRCTVARTVQRAAMVLTVSEFSRDAILRAYDISPDKVRAIPNAANPDFRIVGRERALSAARETLGFQAPFVLSVGDLQPRKNQIGLIAAFSKLLTVHPQLKHHLVLTGKETWFTPRVRAAALSSGFADRIHFTGFVSDNDLLELYNACDCFVFPSFYEGFGLPILEAMACGRAVACSNTSAMPEVADGAGLFFNPHSIDDIKRSMADILLDAELRSRMERLGVQRAAQFSWQKSARATLRVYEEVVAGGMVPKHAAVPAAMAGVQRKR
jgi:glycosyltransferase involved in cell wall biosynthesis